MAGLVLAINETKLCNFLGRSLKGYDRARHFMKLGALAAARVVGRDKPGHDGKIGLSGQISHPDS